jgi:hypothetical protein
MKKSNYQFKCTIHDVVFSCEAPDKERFQNMELFTPECPVCSHEKIVLLRETVADLTEQRDALVQAIEIKKLFTEVKYPK